MRFSAQRLARIASFGSSILFPLLTLAATPTVANLAVSPSGPVESGAILTLTASVTAGGAPLTRGLVTFCDAAAAHCLDAAILGQAQLTTVGMARTKLRLGIGVHSVKAVFHGTTASAASTSTNSSITVTGTYPTTSSISVAPITGGYQLKGTVTASGVPAPTGAISFTDANHGGAPLGSTSLATAAIATGYTPSTDFPTDLVTQIAVGDYNGDGILDIATADSYDKNARVFLGSPDGTFTLKTSPGVGKYPYGIVVSDFNADGIPDLAVLNQGDSTITVLKGNGAGLFTTQATVSVGKTPNGIAAGDFNNDGIPDLATVNGGDTTITILLGNGDGAFTPASSPSVGKEASNWAIVAGDFNGDGLVDLAVSNVVDDTISILLSNGDGTFTLKSSTSLGGYAPYGLVAADFNGDGILDLASADGTASSISVLMGKGDGTFHTLPPFEALYPFNLAVADFNGDGISDLVSAGTSRPLELFAGKGDGTFAPLASVNVEISNTVAAGDFNGDGTIDLASGGWSDLAFFLGSLTSTGSVDNSLAIGTYSLVSSYSGDAVYAASNSAPFPLSVLPATPVFNPQSGIYQWTQNVSITDATAGAIIFYTLDGTAPTTSSPQYSTPIVVSWGNTINAVAFMNSASSPVATATYTIDRPLPAPSISLPSGTYPVPQTITLTLDPGYCSHAVCSIYYTLDGTRPTTDSSLYTGPIHLNSPGSIHFEAIGSSYHFAEGPEAAAVYVLQ